MKTKLQKIFLLAVMFLLSVLAYAVPENNSIFRLQSKNYDGKDVFAVVVGNEIKALTIDSPDYVLENALWLVVLVSDDSFVLQNVGTGKFLNQAAKRGSSGSAKHQIHYLSVSNDALILRENIDNKKEPNAYYYYEKSCKANLYIQYDPYYSEWRYYSANPINGHDPMTESQNQAAGDDKEWTEEAYPPSDEESSMEIPGSEVEKLIGASGNLQLDQIKDKVVETVGKQDAATAAGDGPSIIRVGDSNTYPSGIYWKNGKIYLSVNSTDWTPVSFPVDVRCTYNNSNGAVGFQRFDSQTRANGGNGWKTSVDIAGMIFEQGVAYHFATNSEVTEAPTEIEFEPVSAPADGFISVANKYEGELASVTGTSVEANHGWHYIGNALFKNAGLSNDIRYISRYNGSEWDVQENDGAYKPFDAFFVQVGEVVSYTMDVSAGSLQSGSRAPMRDREVVTEKYCLNIAGEDTEDKTYLYFEDGASAEGYVIGEDFLSFATIGGANTEIYTYAGDIDYSFNTRPIENTLVYVGLYIARAGTYTISLDNISGNAETFVLYDNYEQDFVRLHLGETYTFYSERGEFNDRFGVAVTYAPEVTTDNISLSANKLIVVNNEIQGLILDSELVVYDSTGRLVCVVNVDSETMILPNLNSGIYIARNGNGWVKFLVK